MTDIATVRDWIRDAQRIVVLTGAGISTDSGIPDFRGTEGRWTLSPASEAKATISEWIENAELRRASWQWMLDHPRQAAPNAGHRALVNLERAGKLELLVTQNIDGLHHAAGSAPERVVEIHGSDRETICAKCDFRCPTSRTLAHLRFTGDRDPHCSKCVSPMKPAVISFGQELNRDNRVRADVAARRCDLFIAIGSTLTVFPAAGLLPVAAEKARTVIVNGEPTLMDSVADVALNGRISEVLPQLVAGL